MKSANFFQREHVHKENMFTIELENGREASWKYSSIYFACLSVCILNKRQNGCTDRANIFVGPHVTPERYMEDQIIKNLPLTKFDFWKILKSTIFLKNPQTICFVLFLFYNIYKKNIFTIEMEDWRKVPWKFSIKYMFNCIFVLEKNGIAVFINIYNCMPM